MKERGEQGREEKARRAGEGEIEEGGGSSHVTGPSNCCGGGRIWGCLPYEEGSLRRRREERRRPEKTTDKTRQEKRGGEEGRCLSHVAGAIVQRLLRASLWHRTLPWRNVRILLLLLL